jgi:hypothetical protein
MLKSLRRIHNDEEGLETLQVVMIIAIAAIVLALLKLWWPIIKAWFFQLVSAIVGKDNTGNGGWQPDQNVGP